MPAAMLAVAMAHSAIADAVHFKDDRPAARDVTISLIANATVSFAGADGRVQFASIADIDSLEFDSLPSQQRAESLMQTGQQAEAIRPLATALALAESDAQRIWIHARLARAHDALNQYVLAAGHATAVMALDDSPAWAALAPQSIPDNAEVAAVVEAMHYLARARSVVRSPELITVIDQMHRRVEQELQRHGSAISFDPSAVPTTISGIAQSDLSPEPIPVTETSPKTAATVAAPERSVATVRSTGAASAEQIESLLSASKFDEAVRACEAASRNPGSHDLAELLHQFGQALAGAGRTEDAAVRFMQCTVHFPDSAWAAQSLIDTAILYRDQFDKPSIAKQLLERAAETAENRNESEIVGRARIELEVLSSESP